MICSRSLKPFRKALESQSEAMVLFPIQFHGICFGKVRNFDDTVWKANCRRLVTEGNVAKFGQHDLLRAFLLNTGDQVLVEASPYDRIWGIGLKATDPKAKHPDTWQGQNLLGFSLMDARTALAD